MRWGWGVGARRTKGDDRPVYRILVGKSGWKRPAGRRRLSWEDNIRMDLREISWEVVDWTHLVQDREGGEFLD